MTTALKTVSAANAVSPEEWALRVDLAAAYRLVALYGWDDLIFTHLSARVPGLDHHFLGAIQQPVLVANVRSSPPPPWSGACWQA